MGSPIYCEMCKVFRVQERDEALAEAVAKIEDLKRVGGCEACYQNGLEYRAVLARNADLEKRVEKLEAARDEVDRKAEDAGLWGE